MTLPSLRIHHKWGCVDFRHCKQSAGWCVGENTLIGKDRQISLLGVIMDASRPTGSLRLLVWDVQAVEGEQHCCCIDRQCQQVQHGLNFCGFCRLCDHQNMPTDLCLRHLHISQPFGECVCLLFLLYAFNCMDDRACDMRQV